MAIDSKKGTSNMGGRGVSSGKAGSGASGYKKTNDIPVMRYNRETETFEVSKTKGYTTQKDGYTLNIQVDEGTYRVSMGGMIMDGKTHYSLAEAKQAIDGGIHDYIQKNPEGFKSAELAQNEILSRINKGEKISCAAMGAELSPIVLIGAYGGDYAQIN